MKEVIKNFLIAVITIGSVLFSKQLKSQGAYGSAASYGLRKIVPSYSGNAIQVRRNCDNATLDIGFNSCGDLNTTTLTKFAVLDNTLTGVSTSAATAYSLRKLNCTYSGHVIKVRRSSDNTTKNIDFTPEGDLDTAALKTFVGANNGYITTWYDQSGNTRNATQGTAANQPRIVNAGVIDRYNGVPSLFFNNTGGSGYTICLQTANLNIYTSKACFLGVAAVNTNLTYNCLVVKTNSNNYPSPFDFYCAGGTTTTLLTGDGLNANFFTSTKNFNAAAGMNIWTYQANGTNANGVNGYYDASTQIITNQTASYFGDNSSPVCIGARSDGVTGLNGWISEVLTFTAIPTTADISFLNYTEGTYYGISGPTFVTPSNATNLDAYISIWYDQSGNGNDAVQATTANQPKIVNSGTITTQSGYPTALFDGSSSYLTIPYASNLNLASASTCNAIVARTGVAAGTCDAIFCQQYNASNISAALSWNSLPSPGTTLAYGYYLQSGGVWQNAELGTDITTNSDNIITGTILSAAGNKTAINLYKNGALNNSQTNQLTVGLINTSYGFNIGKRWDLANYAPMNLQELNVFSTAFGTTQRLLEETNQSTYYGVAITGSKYTASSGYIYYVNGVGRTSSTDSVSATRQSGGMGFIVGTTASDYLKDNGDYLTAGMSCLTSAVTTSLYMPVGATAGYERWLNDWYINKTDVSNNGGNVQIYFDFSDYGVSGTPATASNYRLWGRATTTSNFTVVTTTSVAVSGDRVVFTLPAANLGSTGYYTIGTIDYQNSPLPISLLDFTAIANNNKVDLKWETATETNNAYFTIEKSKDGVNFTKLIDMPGAGNSTSEKDYYESDYQPFMGLSYYRLKQTDFNGKYTYFPLRSVTFDGVSMQNITVYPNPINANQNLNIKVNGFKNQVVTVVLRDTQGREFLTKVLLSEDDTNFFVIDELHTIPAGSYIVTASSNDKIYNYKIIVK